MATAETHSIELQPAKTLQKLKRKRISLYTDQKTPTLTLPII